MTMTSADAVQEKHDKQQRLRRFNARILEPGSMWLMILGIIFLCQPWIEILHQYSVTIMLIGIIGFNIAVHIRPPDGPKVDEDDTGPVSVSAAVKGGHHG